MLPRSTKSAYAGLSIWWRGGPAFVLNGSVVGATESFGVLPLGSSWNFLFLVWLTVWCLEALWGFGVLCLRALGFVACFVACFLVLSELLGGFEVLPSG